MLMFNNGYIVKQKQRSQQSSAPTYEQCVADVFANKKIRTAVGGVAVAALLIGAYDAGHRTRTKELAEMNQEHVQARAIVLASASSEAAKKTKEIATKKTARGQRVGVYVLRGEVVKNDIVVKDPLVLASERVPAAIPSLSDESVTIYGAVRVRPNGKVVVRVLGEQSELDGVMVYTDGKEALGMREYVEVEPSQEGLRVPSEPEITPGLILTDKQ